MDLRQLAAFCWADRDFFDTPDRMDDTSSRYADPTELPGGAWRRSDRGLWRTLVPVAADLPEQGWKIHVSTTIADSEKVLEIVWRYCVERFIPVKYLRSERALLMANEKNSARANSGKFITIYPRHNGELATILAELGELLRSFDGPYILGDLRHRSGPLYVRYGAFTEMWCADGDGRRVPALRGPDGTLVPDRRGASFALADWVELPEILAPDLAARQADLGDDFPYRIDKAIQFSNGGGLYLATDQRTGERVIVREARPHAGLDGAGRDAVARLKTSRWALERLAGLDCVPRFIDYRVVGEHHYLVEEYLEGTTLFRAVVTRYPLVEPGVPDDRLTEYGAWADAVLAGVERAVTALHDRGVSINDLHPANIILRPDGTVGLVDFELAAGVTDQNRAALGAPGYAAPESVTGAQADRYALERVRLTTFLPLTALVGRDPSKLATLVDAASSAFANVPGLDRRLRQGLPDDAPSDHADGLFASAQARWTLIKNSLVTAIRASATPDRPDRLFPGDPAQFASGGLDIATGAAGVLYALHRTGNTIDDDHLDWLASRALRIPAPPAGLYTGLHGTAVVLDLLGRRDHALEVLDRVGDVDHAGPANLHSGRAGVALSLLRLAQRTGDTTLRDRAIEIAYRLAGTVTVDGGRSPDRPGLMWGLTGLAALFLALYEETADRSYLDVVERCLRRDLTTCVTRPSGALYVLDGKRNVPHLDTGSLGIAVVADRYLRHRREPELAKVVAAARRGCDADLVFQSGLRQGRAGLILGLAEIGHPRDVDVISRHTRRLGWHAVNHRGGVAFPGAQLARLSMDLFTGSAGVLLAVHAAIKRDGTFLPALGATIPTAHSAKEVNFP